MSDNGGEVFKLREARNVPEVLTRDKLVRRLKRIRERAVIDKNTIEYWNRKHPDEQPIDSSWCDEIIRWCDGEGPPPGAVVADADPGDDLDVPEGHDADDDEDGGWTMPDKDADSLWDSSESDEDDESTEQPA